MVEVWGSPPNAGATWGPPGVGVALYLDDGTSVTLLEGRQTAAGLDPGERLAPMIFEVPLATHSSGGLVVSLDDDATSVGAHNGCDEDTTIIHFSEGVCEQPSRASLAPC